MGTPYDVYVPGSDFNEQPRAENFWPKVSISYYGRSVPLGSSPWLAFSLPQCYSHQAMSSASPKAHGSASRLHLCTPAHGHVSFSQKPLIFSCPEGFCQQTSNLPHHLGTFPVPSSSPTLLELFTCLHLLFRTISIPPNPYARGQDPNLILGLDTQEIRYIRFGICVCFVHHSRLATPFAAPVQNENAEPPVWKLRISKWHPWSIKSSTGPFCLLHSWCSIMFVEWIFASPAPGWWKELVLLHSEKQRLQWWEEQGEDERGTFQFMTKQVPHLTPTRHGWQPHRNPSRFPPTQQQPFSFQTGRQNPKKWISPAHQMFSALNWVATQPRELYQGHLTLDIKTYTLLILQMALLLFPLC